MKIPVQKVISGGQTGIDQLGLEVARSLGIPTGGVAPKGYLTEYGPNSALQEWYGLTEHTSAQYPPRTKANVQVANGTVIFGELTGGTKLTLDACENEGKPYLVNPTADELRAWLIEHKIKILNVAGSRGSKLDGQQLIAYRKILYDALTTNQRLAMLFIERPAQWGLRGDPFLWAELAEVGKTLMLPATPKDLARLLHVLIGNLTGGTLIPGETIHVVRYQHGGMSSGMIDADHWVETMIPLLQERLTKLKKSQTT